MAINMPNMLGPIMILKQDLVRYLAQASKTGNIQKETSKGTVTHAHY